MNVAYSSLLFKNPFSVETTMTVSFQEGVSTSVGQPYIENSNYGYYSIGLMEGSNKCKATYTRETILAGLASLGGLKAFTGILMISFISGYQQFNLDKILMERLYSEEIVVASGKN